MTDRGILLQGGRVIDPVNKLDGTLDVLVIGGGGIRGGQVIGPSDDKGVYVADRMTTMGDVYATIYKAFGIDWEKTYMSPIGRPVKIANSIDDATGVPVHELI